MKICLLSRADAPFGEKIRNDAMLKELQRASLTVECAFIPKTNKYLLFHPGFLLFFVWETIRLAREIGLFWSWDTFRFWVNIAAGAWSLIPQFRQSQFDAVQAETHHSGLCASILRHRFSFLLYVDFHGIAEEIRHGAPSSYQFALAIEKKALTDCDGGSCVSIAMRNYFSRIHGCPTDHLHICHCGTERQTGKASYSLPFRVVYAGSFAYYERVMDFVEAAQLNMDPEIEFYLLGGGENEKEIIDYVQKNSVKLHWLGRKPRAATLEFFKTMQLGISPATCDIVRQTGSPIKILDYAACGLPVVTVDVGEWSEVFREYQAGVVCAQSNPQEILSAIQRLKDPILWQQAAANALRLVEETRLWQITLAPVCSDFQKIRLSGQPFMAPHQTPLAGQPLHASS